MDATKVGSDWTDDELDLIVADYFAMLGEELSGRPYVKRRRRLALQGQIGRSDKSIEFKHMNISAVLVELGLPTILGYKPAVNFQGAIVNAIQRYLANNPVALEPEVWRDAIYGVAEPSQPYVEPPPPLGPHSSGWERSPELARIVRKFDPVERDFRNRKLGRAGEEFIFSFERSRLQQQGRDDLANKVRWISEEDGDGAGFDILSFEPSGTDRLLEVKTTNGGKTTPFFVTRNEKALSDERSEAFRIVRVFDFARNPRIFELPPPLEHSVVLTPENWRASF